MSYYIQSSGAQVRVSTISGLYPNTELLEGELAVNVSDGAIFVKHCGIVYNLTNSTKLSAVIASNKISELEAKIQKTNCSNREVN